ncbi:PTS sugar transporter subunit IIB [Virgibacillus halodenitrificans]|uniref:PTS sugar transporter subunit IIB n=1 Tax=Virgibacillus halodenitrificans TaxID=1482 RepID=UPI000EF4AA20|nr:PTS sugar transporter subunit IIB [Virgibacillus halodenitrificans]MYL57618.1 PTS sugar transporter subunit IIB [Virgibacillus halodenitrificans]
MNVLFVCAGGMSSAIVVKALKEEGKKKGQDLHVHAIGSNEVAEEIKNDWDVCMVAPQIRHRFKQINEQANEAGVPCGAIPPQAYTPMGGPLLLKTLNELAK